MAYTSQLEEQLRTFRQHFEASRVDLGITARPDSVKAVFSAATITDAKNLVIYLILALVNQPNICTIRSQNPRANRLANLFNIGSGVFADSFDIKLAIPLIEEVVNNGPDESIYSAVSDLAGHLQVTSPTPCLKVASDPQPSASRKATKSNSSSGDDEPEFRAPKRAKLAYGYSKREENCSDIGRRYDTGASNIGDCFEESALDDESPMFQYRPLDTIRREIRLLVLHPREEVLSYSSRLIHVSMDEDPEYEALSYVWGSQANKKKILINGRQLSVTANLAEALYHLYDSNSPRKLWVDAICINQDNSPERSQQVQKMTEIYARASNVVVWLGVLGITTQRLLHRLENPEDNDQSPKHLRRWTISGDRIMVDPSVMKEEDKILLSELAQNPWFGRVWVIQEVAVARAVIVQTGRTTIPWPAFSAALEKCSNNHKMKSVIEAVSTINTIRNARSQKPYYMDLLVLLERFRHCLATDDRDKVFALLGLASNSLAQEKVLQIIPDYSKPVFDIYRSLTWHYINQRKNLDIICHATVSNHVPIPSWVPNWSYYNPGLSVFPKRCIVGDRHEPMYRCCGDMELDRELLFGTEVSGNRLWLNGFNFDVVSLVGRVANKAHDLGLELPINGVTDLLQEWKSMSEICSHVYGSNVEEAFRRTLLADAIGEKRCQENMHSTFIATKTDRGALINDSVVESSPTFVYLTEGRLGTVEKESHSSIEEPLNSREELREASMKRAAIKRSFFVTEKGYMGLGPFSMEERDLVYVLSGGQVPFILRPLLLTEGFSLVGESYIHGIMNGEATVLGIEVETIYLL